MDKEMARLFLLFVRERHLVYTRRRAGLPQHQWTADEVLARRKFTNVFRVLDRGSQFVVGELLRGPDQSDMSKLTMLMRCWLYRYTNRPEPWEYFYMVHGRYPAVQDLEDLLPQTWGEYSAAGYPIFGSAYRGAGGLENPGMSRLDWTLNAVRNAFSPWKYPEYIGHDLAMANTVAARVEVLQRTPRCGPFMAMQVATDIGYSSFQVSDENEMVLLGPGALRGAALIAPGADAMDVVSWASRKIPTIVDAPTIGLPRGDFRSPSLMDVQNCLCEFSKYVRYRKYDQPDQPYTAHTDPLPTPVLPYLWTL